jgi:RNA polymerase sigma-70 factor (ECF subfamily)
VFETQRLDAPHRSAVTEPILPRVATGDPAAVEQCLDRYGGLVWSLARRYFARPSDAEDAVQEAFLSLWENAGRFDPAIASETTYVAMIARRRLIDLVRRGKAVRRSLPAGEGDAAPPVEQLAAPAGPEFSTGGVTLRGFEVAEEAQRVRNQLARLSEDQQEVLRLALIEGQSQTQIAEALALPLGTVKSHARRGLQRLRELLQEDPSEPSVTKQPVPNNKEAER